MPKVKSRANRFTFVPFEKLKATKAWKLTSEYVRKKSQPNKEKRGITGICYTCGKEFPFKKLSAGHFREKRGNAGVYFDLDNLRAQCGGDNWRKGGLKDIYAWKLKKEIGEERFNNLFKKSVGSKVWNKQELYEIEIERQKLINELK